MDPTQPIRNYGLHNHHKDYSFYWLNIYQKICPKIDCDLGFIVQIAGKYIRYPKEIMKMKQHFSMLQHWLKK